MPPAPAPAATPWEKTAAFKTNRGNRPTWKYATAVDANDAFGNTYNAAAVAAQLDVVSTVSVDKAATAVATGFLTQFSAYLWWAKKDWDGAAEKSDEGPNTVIPLYTWGTPKLRYRATFQAFDSDSDDLTGFNSDVMVIRYGKRFVQGRLQAFLEKAADPMVGATPIVFADRVVDVFAAFVKIYTDDWPSWPNVIVCVKKEAFPALKSGAANYNLWTLPLKFAVYRPYKPVKQAAAVTSEYSKKVTLLWQVIGGAKIGANAPPLPNKASAYPTATTNAMAQSLMFSRAMYSAVQRKTPAELNLGQRAERALGLSVTSKELKAYANATTVPAVCVLVLRLVNPPRTAPLEVSSPPKVTFDLSVSSSPGDIKLSLPHAANVVVGLDFNTVIAKRYVCVDKNIGSEAEALDYLQRVFQVDTTTTQITVASANGLTVITGVRGTLMAVREIPATVTSSSETLPMIKVSSLKEYPFDGCFIDAYRHLYLHIAPNTDGLTDGDMMIAHAYVSGGPSEDRRARVVAETQRVKVADRHAALNASALRFWGSAQPWQSGHSYSVGDRVVGRVGDVDRVFTVEEVNGTSGAREPNWQEGRVTDNDVTFSINDPGTIGGDQIKPVAVTIKAVETNGRVTVDPPRVPTPGVLVVSSLSSRTLFYTSCNAQGLLGGLDGVVDGLGAGMGGVCYPLQNAPTSALLASVTSATTRLCQLMAPPKTLTVKIPCAATTNKQIELIAKSDSRSYDDAYIDFFGLQAFEDAAVETPPRVTPFEASTLKSSYDKAALARDTLIDTLFELSRTACDTFATTASIESLADDDIKAIGTLLRTKCTTVTEQLIELSAFAKKVDAQYIQPPPAIPALKPSTLRHVVENSLKEKSNGNVASFALGTPEQITGLSSMIKWLQTIELPV